MLTFRSVFPDNETDSYFDEIQVLVVLSVFVAIIIRFYSKDVAINI